MLEIHEYKHPHDNFATEKFLTPRRLYLPMSQHTGKAAVPTVKIGEYIDEGSVIGLDDGLISARVHASQKGKVVGIENSLHPNLKRSLSVIIECIPDTKAYVMQQNAGEWDKTILINVIKNNGIVGMGGAAFPTHVKLTPSKPIDVLIINGCECEPYLSADNRLMLENITQIFLGIQLICKIISPKNVVFAIEDNKLKAIQNVNRFIALKKVKLPPIKVAVLKTKYPQGGEKQLIYRVLGRKVPGGKLPFDVGCLVQNVATTVAIYEAVYFNKPLIERLVTFAGDALVTPKNIWVKIGTTLNELFEQKILVFKNEPKKIICGGPMMGVTLDNLNYPILKGTGGFLFLSKNITLEKESSCIRCARCVHACPMHLMPLEYAKRIKVNAYGDLNDLNITDCIECGCCSYVCPSKIPLVHYIKLGKKYAVIS